MEKRKIFLVLIGIFFIVISIIGIIINIVTKTPYNLVWFCNHTTLILGLAFLFRSSFWITAEINIGFFPQLLWSIDFLSKLIFNRFVFGFTDYMFSPHYHKALYILSWNHIFMLPIALIGLYLLDKPPKDAWKGSLIHGIILIPLSYIFAYGTNLNCLHESCLFFIPSNIFYKTLWLPLIMVIFIILMNYILCLVYKKIKKKNK